MSKIDTDDSGNALLVLHVGAPDVTTGESNADKDQIMLKVVDSATNKIRVVREV